MTRVLLSSIGILLFLTTFGAAEQKATAAGNSDAPCAEPQHAQFDFWVGEWDATWPGDKPGVQDHGTNSIRRMMGGCVVEEHFSGGDTMPLRGMSVSTFDARSNQWKQTWVDNQGSYLDFVGEFKDRQMILWRHTTSKDGNKLLQRMVFKNIGAKEFDWSWERSVDNGKTWQVVWPIHYTRKI